MKYLVLGLGLLAACSTGGDSDSDDDHDDDRRLGGDTTIDDRSAAAFSHPAANLATTRIADFDNGNGPFSFHWPNFQLGPLFNADSCMGCHDNSGRGQPVIGAVQSQALVRVSLDDGTPGEPGGDVPVPGLGLQLQDHVVTGTPEVVIVQHWVEHAESFGDGTPIMLRAPMLDITTPDGQPLASEIRTSFRQGPPLIGMGLLEAVPAASILALADPDDADGNGISGRANQVWDRTHQATVLGRFGHKATDPTVRQQVGDAFGNDIGITNAVVPSSDGSAAELVDPQLEVAVVRVAMIAVPAAAALDDTTRLGRQRLDDFGCSSCHVATLVTGDSPALPELAHQTIHPFTDLLLHDLGDGLADGRRDFLADGNEWRTAPLWGLGLAPVISPGASYLHDGRARTLDEAILWHGGEASAAREAFRAASKADRDALLAFLGTL